MSRNGRSRTRTDGPQRAGGYPAAGPPQMPTPWLVLGERRALAASVGERADQADLREVGGEHAPVRGGAGDGALRADRGSKIATLARQAVSVSGSPPASVSVARAACAPSRTASRSPVWLRTTWWPGPAWAVKNARRAWRSLA
jgi:hypothetical protein